MSTMHQPMGLMQRLVESAASSGRDVLRWSIVDVLERCPPARACEGCDLWGECGGRAKHAAGFVRIDDAITQKKRVSRSVWVSEMLCEQPNRSYLVYPMFDPAVGGRHVQRFEAPPAGDDVTWLGGIDFGYHGLTVFLWAFVDASNVLHIVDEFARNEHTTDQVMAYVRAQSWPRPRWIGADPSGNQRSVQTSVATIALWRRGGYAMRDRSMGIAAGIEAVLTRMERADGAILLRIHPRCRHLIKSLATYHYPHDDPGATAPDKDGADHACDALRYLIVNLDRGRGTLKQGGY